MRYLIAFLLGGMLFFGCERIDDEMGETPQLFAQLRVSVLDCSVASDPFCEETDPVSGAVVHLYETEAFRNAGEPILFEGITNTQGYCTFNQVQPSGLFYIRVIGCGGIFDSATTTPSNGIAYHEVLCEE